LTAEECIFAGPGYLWCVLGAVAIEGVVCYAVTAAPVDIIQRVTGLPGWEALCTTPLLNACPPLESPRGSVGSRSYEFLRDLPAESSYSVKVSPRGAPSYPVWPANFMTNYTAVVISASGMNSTTKGSIRHSASLQQIYHNSNGTRIYVSCGTKDSKRYVFPVDSTQACTFVNSSSCYVESDSLGCGAWAATGPPLFLLL